MCLSLSTRSTKKCSHPCQIGWVISNRKSYIQFLRYDNKYFVMKLYHGCWCQIKFLQHFMVMWWHIAWILNENRKNQKKRHKIGKNCHPKVPRFSAQFAIILEPNATPNFHTPFLRPQMESFTTLKACLNWAVGIFTSWVKNPPGGMTCSGCTNQSGSVMRWPDPGPM